MIQAMKKAYSILLNCNYCDNDIKIFFTAPDFGDPPSIVHCRYCNESYWYTPEDEFYIKKLDEQLFNKRCIKCNSQLSDAIVPTYTSIQCNCCFNEISFSKDFCGKFIPNDNEMEPIQVTLIYS